MKSCLIVYYSRTGTTATIAAALAQACGADLEEIRALRPRRGVAGYLRSAWEALRGRPADIAAPRHDPSAYPIVVLGSPVWGGRMSSPMRAYIEHQRAHLHRVGLFCTMGGSGGERVLDAMALLCDKVPQARLCLREPDVRAGRHGAAVADFAGALVQAGQPADARPGRIHGSAIADAGADHAL